MTKNERERAIKEGHKIHAETSYFTPRPQLDFVNARYVFCEGFDRGYIAATTEANKRMAELQASNNRLRDGIAEIAVEAQDTYTNAALTKLLSATQAQSLIEHDNEVLERAAKEIDVMVATYVESGNKYHEVSEGRERCVNKARAAMSCAETIRALKEVK